MADHYKKVIIQGLKEFAPNQTAEICNLLSWIGLMGSGEESDCVTGLLPLSTVAWKNISQLERIKILKI
ncbi:hypothetical protein D3C72_2449870 [compost metagenome]